MSGRIRVKLESNYTKIPNSVLRSDTLTWKAKGLLCYLLSLSDDWTVYKKDLQKRAKDGYDSMITAWNELELLGYIESIPVREKGMFKGYDYLISDTPIRENPETVIPESDIPHLIINNKQKELNKEIDSKKESINVELFPTQRTPPKISFTEKCNLFVAAFNKIRGGKFQATTQVKTAFKARLVTHTANEIIKALKNAMSDKYHIDNNFMYLTPEFILREDKLERYLNIKIENTNLTDTGDMPAKTGAQL